MKVSSTVEGERQTLAPLPPTATTRLALLAALALASCGGDGASMTLRVARSDAGSGTITGHGNDWGFAHAVTVPSSTLMDPLWTTAGNMVTPRDGHTATLLSSGKVLVAGGGGDFGAVSATELFDPGTGTWSATGSLALTHGGHTATLLPSGMVLVAGGGPGLLGGGRSDYSQELYDPSTGTWRETSGMVSRRSGHTATLLPSGKVLIVGGLEYCGRACGGEVVHASAELYQPDILNAVTGSMATGRVSHTATLLPSGRVLVVGGRSRDVLLASSELYDPVTGMWSPTGSLSAARERHTALLLPSGMVLVVGGDNLSGVLASAEVYDPAIGTWNPTGSLATGRLGHTATLLPSGQVLVAGGASGASAEMYDPATGTWGAAGTMATARAYHTATPLAAGGVLVAGGFQVREVSAEIYDLGVVDYPLGISPTNATLPPKVSEIFSAVSGSGKGYTWTFVTNASGGTLSSSGVYTAGATGSVSDVISLTDSMGKSATATVTVTATFAISPPTATVAPNGDLTFTPSGGAPTRGWGSLEGYTTWGFVTNASGGRIAPWAGESWLYIAGPTGGVTDVIFAEDSVGNTAMATVTVTQPAKSSSCATAGGGAFPLLVLVVLPLMMQRAKGAERLGCAADPERKHEFLVGT